MREIFLLKTGLINISALRKILVLMKKALVWLAKKLQIFLLHLQVHFKPLSCIV